LHSGLLEKGAGLLAAARAVANLGDAIEKSLQRYGKSCLVDRDRGRLIWDNGDVTLAAI
jgi:hypothetical protein